MSTNTPSVQERIAALTAPDAREVPDWDLYRSLGWIASDTVAGLAEV